MSQAVQEVIARLDSEIQERVEARDRLLGVFGMPTSKAPVDNPGARSGIVDKSPSKPKTLKPIPKEDVYGVYVDGQEVKPKRRPGRPAKAANGETWPDAIDRILKAAKEPLKVAEIVKELEAEGRVFVGDRKSNVIRANVRRCAKDRGWEKTDDARWYSL